MNENDLRNVMARLGVRGLKRKNVSGWLHTSCPMAPWKHRNGTDRSSSFGVKVCDDGKSAYVCMACHDHGTIPQLARTLGRLRGADYSEVAMMAEHADLDTMSNIPDFETPLSEAVALQPIDESLFGDLFEKPYRDPVAKGYLIRRGISEDTCAKLSLGYDPDKKRIVFPVRDGKGLLYGWSGRTILPHHEPKVLDYMGLPKRSLILGQERWKPNRKTIIVEGLFAYAHFVEEGVDDTYNVGALLGSTVTPEKAAILKDFDAPVVWILDNDVAGDAGIFGRPTIDEKTGEELRDLDGSAVFQLHGHVPQFVPEYPQGINDPDDLSTEDIVKMVEDAPLWLPSQEDLDRWRSGGDRRSGF